jgi:hypothetical protein
LAFLTPKTQRRLAAGDAQIRSEVDHSLMELERLKLNQLAGITQIIRHPKLKATIMDP